METIALKTTLRNAGKLLPDVKILFPHHRLHVSFADEFSRKAEEDLIMDFVQSVYKLYMEIPIDETAHINQGFTTWSLNVFRFDYKDSVMRTLLMRDVKGKY